MSISKPTILVVEDEAIVAADIASQLGRLGYEACGTVRQGEDAIRHARELRPDLVLMDIKLAGAMDGVEAAEIIHREFDLPVIFLTAHSDRATLDRAKRVEPFGYLLKPFDDHGLETHIEMALYKHRAECKLRKAYEELEQRVQERTLQLREKNRELQEINTTLNTILKRREKELNEIRKEIAAQTARTVLPLLKKAQARTTGSIKNYLVTAEANLLDIFSTHSHDSVLTNAKLAPRELQIIHYLRQNKSSKEIADLLNLTVRTVETYRENIRKKLRITNRKINLRKFISSLL